MYWILCECVNSFIWMVRLGVRINNLVCSKATPFMYTMSGHKFAEHVHSFVSHGQLIIHGGMVLSWELSFLFTNIGECEAMRAYARFEKIGKLVGKWDYALQF